MQTYHIQENYTVQASTKQTAEDAVLTGAEGVRFKQDYRLSVTDDTSGDWIVVYTTKQEQTDIETGSRSLLLHDHWRHFHSYEYALSFFREVQNRKSTYSASLTEVIQSTDYGV